MMPFQILFLAVYLLYFLFQIKRRISHKIKTTEFLFRFTFWSVATAIVLFPQFTVDVAHFFGIHRGSDFIVYLSVILLFYYAFNQRVNLIRSDRSVTELNRRIAILEYRLKKQSESSSNG